MKLTFALGEQEHWVELRDDVIWTRGRVTAMFAADPRDESVVRQMDPYVTGCHIVDAEGRAHDEWGAITGEVLDNLHPAVLTFVAVLPRHAMNQQAVLGNLRGGRS